jgi:hypothetical protein
MLTPDRTYSDLKAFMENLLTLFYAALDYSNRMPAEG